MKKRELKRISHSQIILGKIYPQLLELRDSENCGLHGELNMQYRGFIIKYIGGQLPKPQNNPFDDEMK